MTTLTYFVIGVLAAPFAWPLLKIGLFLIGLVVVLYVLIELAKTND